MAPLWPVENEKITRLQLCPQSRLFPSATVGSRGSFPGVAGEGVLPALGVEGKSFCPSELGESHRARFSGSQGSQTSPGLMLNSITASADTSVTSGPLPLSPADLRMPWMDLLFGILSRGPELLF